MASFFLKTRPLADCGQPPFYIHSVHPTRPRRPGPRRGCRNTLHARPPLHLPGAVDGSAWHIDEERSRVHSQQGIVETSGLPSLGLWSCTRTTSNNSNNNSKPSLFRLRVPLQLLEVPRGLDRISPSASQQPDAEHTNINSILRRRSQPMTHTFAGPSSPSVVARRPGWLRPKPPSPCQAWLCAPVINVGKNRELTRDKLQKKSFSVDHAVIVSARTCHPTLGQIKTMQSRLLSLRVQGGRGHLSAFPLPPQRIGTPPPPPLLPHSLFTAPPRPCPAALCHAAPCYAMLARSLAIPPPPSC